MFRRITCALAGAALAVALACVSPPRVEPPAGVTMDDSFSIPGAGALSHAPAVAFTDDGRMIAVTADGEIAIFDTATKRLLRRVKVREAGTDAVSIDRSGRYVAWVLKTGLAVMSATSGAVLARDSMAATCVAIAPDGNRLAVARGATVEVRELRSLALLRAIPRGGGDVTALAWSADGAMVASVSADGHLVVTRGGETVYEVKKEQALYAVAFHPSGREIAYGGKDRQVCRYEFASGTEDVISQGQPYGITALGYSPDGERLAVGDDSCDVWVYRVATKEMAFHHKHHNECWVSTVAWAPDSGALVFGCRANGRTPTLHEPLVRAEAARTQAVRTSRATLLAAIEGALAKEGDATMRERLAEYRRSVAVGEEPGVVRGWQGYIAWPSTNNVISPEIGPEPDWGTAPVNLNSATAPSFAIESDAPALALPVAIQELARRHDDVVRGEMRKIAANYNVNVWRVAK
jgi:dipeptidyl aminopeptidase/acylaminoacyl peptidase